ncbi:hypothetical protein CU102_03715 [Phyllobacterium brassicacearum]|uniref:Uncharacterized protein n=1 Tax=Phyllobacterium brassicacearum TaxID=314235 RepID=A0A2P7BUS1_9HYPH|nr:hypothetical protein [Phyllobacterium brassicacearum]PSH70206.1 hypothetical protein CU102_03715 [Phyllobacterium brassicacearum]TDQ33905.1 hypothetical protein DEV91_104108 [Phyllobacterium brassicacearum]
MHHRQNIERDPEYVRERIEATQNFGRKYLISIGLFAILITTMQGDFDRPALFASSLSVSHELTERSPQEASETCSYGHDTRSRQGMAATSVSMQLRQADRGSDA